MEWLITAFAVLVLGLGAFAAAGRFGSMPPPVDDVFAPQLPTTNITAEDIRQVRFGVTLRGYDMAQVDDLLARLARQLEEAKPAASLATTGASVSPAPELVDLPHDGEVALVMAAQPVPASVLLADADEPTLTARDDSAPALTTDAE